jgi:hypothetical protein
VYSGRGPRLRGRVPGFAPLAADADGFLTGREFLDLGAAIPFL